MYYKVLVYAVSIASDLLYFFMIRIRISSLELDILKAFIIESEETSLYLEIYGYMTLISFLSYSRHSSMRV